MVTGVTSTDEIGRFKDLDFGSAWDEVCCACGHLVVDVLAPFVGVIEICGSTYLADIKLFEASVAFVGVIVAEDGPFPILNLFAIVALSELDSSSDGFFLVKGGGI
jgi:hypothetical protein